MHKDDLAFVDVRHPQQAHVGGIGGLVGGGQPCEEQNSQQGSDEQLHEITPGGSLLAATRREKPTRIIYSN